MSALRLIYHPEDELHGELSATVESGEFRGLGSAWFNIGQLREFWRLTGAYPLSESAGPILEGGFYAAHRRDTLQQCHLSVRLSPHDRLGSVRVIVTVATDARNGEEADLQQSLTARFRVTYGDIDRFRAAFAAMLDGQADEAILEGAPG